MSESKRWLAVAALVLLPLTANAQISPPTEPFTAETLLELQDMVEQIPQACPKPWENLNVDIAYTPTADVWQNDLADKAAYVRYASDYLVDATGDFIIDNFHDPKEIILICGGLRHRLFELLEIEAYDVQAGLGADADGDGISDAIDQCANTLANETVNIIGCAYYQQDDDADGVQNGDDLCANTSTQEVADANGCAPTQRDTDGDGVNDALDQCPNTTPGLTPTAYGCALSEVDSDGDGINDDVDAYPLQPDTQCSGGA